VTLSQNPDDLAQAMLDAAKQAGADAADAIVVSGESQSIETLSGKLETADSAEGVDIGLRAKSASPLGKIPRSRSRRA